MELLLLIVAGMVVLVGVVIIAKSVVVVPQQSAYVVERLGKYAGTLHAGFHTLTPFFDVIRYRHTL
jgi:regulator of protease activity HflC (stomatin/prohibitin superfamily)